MTAALDFAPNPGPLDPPTTLGMAAITRWIYEGRDPSPLWTQLLQRASSDASDAAALMDMSIILQANGHRDQALDLQANALKRRRAYGRPHGRGDGLRVLAFVTAGDFMANTPIDFLLQGSDAMLTLFYVDAEGFGSEPIPEHDVAFLAIGESAENLPVLARCAELLAHWPKPILNAAPLRIAGLTRDGVCAALADAPTLLAPVTTRIDRAALIQLSLGVLQPSDLIPDAVFPIIVRPIGTHAGQGMEKLDDRYNAAIYLQARPETEFYLSPFVDYADADGLFRKQRIAFIGGRAYPSHFAVSSHWMVHYLSAEMTERPERRAEESAWMGDFDVDFAMRHAASFQALQERLGLDYFGIDCAELSDGRLMVFEADVAMIVHDLDSEEVFPYKKPAMRRLFAAFHEALQAAAQGQALEHAARA